MFIDVLHAGLHGPSRSRGRTILSACSRLTYPDF